MNDADRAAVRENAVQHAESVLTTVEDRWGNVPHLDALPVEPLSAGDSFPASAEAFHDRFYPYAAGASVVDEGRLLCVYSPARDEWETPGGAGETGETPAETARRETEEETGIDCEITDVLFAQTMELRLDAPERLPIPVVGFTARPVGGDELVGVEVERHDEITDLTWFEPDELPSELRNYERKHAHLVSCSETTSD
ncbi:MutT/NUDIX family protein [Halococcus morrhuae DSM 1307]|uniref:MutT/NUDIX family protein n=1 Tax=Halococcus morrhuae DSM 1307 TaxID=931277 RepID=M0MRD4_HALMO|nr:NUDIX domain-containing protein [Halococcus morrhuae]EMA48292.1 MutT/NUDIX family protein [Halococcus morrhuae DSM 1307]